MKTKTAESKVESPTRHSAHSLHDISGTAEAGIPQASRLLTAAARTASEFHTLAFLPSGIHRLGANLMQIDANRCKSDANPMQIQCKSGAVLVQKYGFASP